MTPATRILLEEAQKMIDLLKESNRVASEEIELFKRKLNRANAEIKSLKMELEQSTPEPMCKCCYEELIEESIIKGVCRDCFERVDIETLHAKFVKRRDQQ